VFKPGAKASDAGASNDRARGAPLSKYARRYQSPSHPCASRLPRKRAASATQVPANASSPRPRASSAKSSSTAYKKNPSHTLSPRPSAPTRFIPSFQSPPPMEGSPWTPKSSPCWIARAACSYKVPTSSEITGRS